MWVSHLFVVVFMLFWEISNEPLLRSFYKKNQTIQKNLSYL